MSPTLYLKMLDYVTDLLDDAQDFSWSSAKDFGISFAYDAPKICNDLPADVRSATSLHSFRKKLQAYLFAQAYPS